MLNIKLPANIRNQVRSLVRNHPGFDAWRIANGDFDSRDMGKDRTMKAIADLGLETMVRDLIATGPQTGLGTATLHHPDFEGADVSDFDEPEPMADMLATMEGDEQSLTDSVLDPLKPFLSSTLLDAVTKALEPIVKAAVKPAVSHETIRTVYVDDAGNPVAPVMIE